MPVQKTSISNTPGVYECFPDVARAADGRLVVVYRESDSHGAKEYAHLVFRSSRDDGKSWSERRLLAESRVKDGVLWKWNCPRLRSMEDGRLLALCDGYAVPPGEKVGSRSVVSFWWSRDHGESWEGPQETPIRGIVPDRLVLLPSGAWLVAAHGRTETGQYHQWCYRSEDRGATWQGPFTILLNERYRPCEASVLPLPSGELVCTMRENSGRGWPALRCYSKDDGRTWEGPYETLMDACHRPVSGHLPGSHRVLTTYRHHPGGAGYWAKNTFAFVESLESASERDRAKQRGIVLPLDHDRSPKSDSGYTGWVVLPGGQIFVVNYLLDDSPDAQIRGYWLDEADF